MPRVYTFCARSGSAILRPDASPRLALPCVVACLLAAPACASTRADTAAAPRRSNSKCAPTRS